MWDSEHLKKLMEMSEAQSEKINIDLKVFEETFNGLISNAPSDQKGKLESIKARINKATELAKQGKTAEAQQIINNIQNER